VRYDQTVDNANAVSDVRFEAKVTQPRLYNLARDVGEKEDLAAARPEKVAELQSLWNSWAAELKERFGGRAGRSLVLQGETAFPWIEVTIRLVDSCPQ
jgi:hypothetical protein